MIFSPFLLPQYQIRFLGYKGVVAVDEQLKGIQMCLRPSMGKFENKKAKEAEIEIAQAFERPVTCYLNRCVPYFVHICLIFSFYAQTSRHDSGGPWRPKRHLR